MQKHTSSERLTDDLFERALSDSLRDFVHIAAERLLLFNTRRYFYKSENFSYCCNVEAQLRLDCIL